MLMPGEFCGGLRNCDPWWLAKSGISKWGYHTVDGRNPGITNQGFWSSLHHLCFPLNPHTLGIPDVPTIPGGSTGSGKGAGLKTATLGDRIPVWVRKKPAIWKLCLKRIHSKWWFIISGMILTSSWMCFVFWWVAYNSSLGIVIITTMISNTTHKPHESTEKERSNHHGFSSIQCHVLANGHPCKLSKVVLPGVPLTGGGLASGFGRFEVYRQMLGAWILGGVPLRMPSKLSSLIAGRFSKICGQIERLIHTPLIQKDLDWLWNILAALLYARYYQSSLQVMGWLVHKTWPHSNSSQGRFWRGKVSPTSLAVESDKLQIKKWFSPWNSHSTCQEGALHQFSGAFADC